MPSAVGPSGRGEAPTGLAVLGGAFNPPHTTHVRLAALALARLPITEVRVVPAGDHPHKRQRGMASAADRIAMCRLAFAGMPGVVVDARELRRAGPSFTVDTLAEIATEEPGRPLFFVIGSDNLPLLPTWHDHHRLLSMATVVTVPRAGHPVRPDDLRHLDLSDAERGALLAHVLDVPAETTAASDVRARWRAGDRDLADVPAAVRDYIAAHSVY